MKFNFDELTVTEVTDAWLVNVKTGERVLHLDQAASADASWTSADEFKAKWIRNKEGSFSLAPVMSQEGRSRIDED